MTRAQRQYCWEQFGAVYGPLADYRSKSERDRYLAWLGVFTLGFEAGLQAAMIRADGSEG